MNTNQNSPRRSFLKKSSFLAAGLITAPFLSQAQATPLATSDNMYIIGPQEGYSPQIGTLLSTMTMMRHWVTNTVKDLTKKQLDFQLDDNSNSIGAMLLHLAATERFYQLNTFDEIKWKNRSDEIKKDWDVPMGLGKDGREQIKGNNIDYYITKLTEVRDVTHKEFANSDDTWLMKSESFFEDKPTNNYCKWFHVCEHESNHNGQMKLIKSRIPG